MASLIRHGKSPGRPRLKRRAGPRLYLISGIRPSGRRAGGLSWSQDKTRGKFFEFCRGPGYTSRARGTDSGTRVYVPFPEARAILGDPAHHSLDLPAPPLGAEYSGRLLLSSTILADVGWRTPQNTKLRAGLAELGGKAGRGRADNRGIIGLEGSGSSAVPLRNTGYLQCTPEADPGCALWPFPYASGGVRPSVMRGVVAFDLRAVMREWFIWSGAVLEVQPQVAAVIYLPLSFKYPQPL
ncbi:hypothetical protein DFH09DRAFT_1075967 [Mycena vulgaris]|nr:hypothetical protein DFH09DRAFT_1075967 [Mycena vulgaris]